MFSGHNDCISHVATLQMNFADHRKQMPTNLYCAAKQKAYLISHMSQKMMLEILSYLSTFCTVLHNPPALKPSSFPRYTGWEKENDNR